MSESRLSQADKDDAAELIRIAASEACCDGAWEAAYARFETPEQETNKFRRRLRKMGVDAWSRNAAVVELFCGRGNGLRALHDLGFTRLEGVDLSASLLAQYRGPARCYVCDCRQLPFPDGSKDMLVIQGGLHHLASPADLEQTLAETNRVLQEHGRVFVVEPWLTRFLSVVHWACRNGLARRLSPKLDALATMIDHERTTYEQWLGQPQEILRLFAKYFHTERCSFGWTKWMFVGRKKNGRSRMPGADGP
jgi:ubiquinone/menaquinone biosynthesis C-methylase UbiE